MAATIMPARQALLDTIKLDDPWGANIRDYRETQLEALREALTVRREQVVALDGRAKQLGIHDFRSVKDAIPLYFSHSVFKSYPEAILERRNWKQLARWMSTLSAVPGLNEMDFSGVDTIDQWLARLHENGHIAFATSGTGGKCSFGDESTDDWEYIVRRMRAQLIEVSGQKPAHKHRAFFFTFKKGYQKFITVGPRAYAEVFSTPEKTHWLFDEAALVEDANRLGKLRRAMATGTATPEQLTEIQDDAAKRQKHTAERTDAMIDMILKHRHEPLLIPGLWNMHWLILERARERGIKDGDMHPDNVIMGAGGAKGSTMPPDYREQITRFYGYGNKNFRMCEGYGMSEITEMMPMCPQRRYHAPAWVQLTVLDEAGQEVFDPIDGPVTGRLALFDHALSSRWGGIVTGDKVTVSYDCPCGRKSAAIHDPVVRYIELQGNDDKLTCSGTQDAYVRGLIEA